NVGGVRAGCARSPHSQVPSRVAVMTIRAVDVAGGRRRTIRKRKPTGTDRSWAQAGHHSPHAAREARRAHYRVVRHAERKLHASVALVRISRVELALRISSKADSARARVSRLRTIGAVSVTFEADLVFVPRDWQEGVPLRLAFHSQH